jgi:hypothetical protein
MTEREHRNYFRRFGRRRASNDPLESLGVILLGSVLLGNPHAEVMGG